MAVSQGNRIKQLSKHIATTIHHICYGIFSLCRSYVLLEQFTTDL